MKKRIAIKIFAAFVIGFWIGAGLIWILS